MAPLTSARRLVVLLDPARAALATLRLPPPLVARSTRLGLLVAGASRSAGDLRLARSLGARVFEETDARIFEERDGGDALPAGEPGATEAFLIASDGAAWRVQDPARWPPIGKVLLLEAHPRPLEPSLVPLPSRRLRLEASTSPGARSGLLGRSGDRSGMGEHLLALRPEDLEELRLGHTRDGWWWLYAPRGLPQAMEAGGARLLRNLGTEIEPVLVPSDREPRPAVPALRIRRVFDAPEGSGLLWWDAEVGERHVFFARIALARIEAELARSFPW